MHTPLQQGELDTHDTFSSGAYLVFMGMACTLFMLFVNTRLQFRIAGEVEPSTSELHVSGSLLTRPPDVDEELDTPPAPRVVSDVSWQYKLHRPETCVKYGWQDDIGEDEDTGIW